MSWTERAFDLVTEISKQVITLSTGMIALGITFNKDFVSGASDAVKHMLGLSWGAFLIAIVFALLTLMASTGAQSKAATTPPDPYSTGLRILASVQLVMFLAGLILSTVAGVQGIPR